MRFTYTDEVKDYMREKGLGIILVFMQPYGCCGTYDHAARLIGEDAASRYRAEGAESFEGELGEVLIREDSMERIRKDAEISFEIANFLGVKTLVPHVA